MEDKVASIYRNVTLFMVALVNNLGPLRDVGVSNLDIILEGKPRENEDPKKESSQGKTSRKSNQVQCHYPFIVLI
jgi:hypothetical protein